MIFGDLRKIKTRDIYLMISLNQIPLYSFARIFSSLEEAYRELRSWEKSNIDRDQNFFVAKISRKSAVGLKRKSPVEKIRYFCWLFHWRAIEETGEWSRNLSRGRRIHLGEWQNRGWMMPTR